MPDLQKLGLLARTLPRLGAESLGCLAWYRLRMKLGAFVAASQNPENTPTRYFRTMDTSVRGTMAQAQTDHFGKTAMLPADSAWHQDPTDNTLFDFGDRPWPQALAAFPANRDIKNIWELSRFYWAPRLAALAATTGEAEYILQLNAALIDWLRSNPSGNGLNWACGQESAIRMLHLAAAAMILDQDRSPEPDLLEFAAIIEQRVEPTLGYALSQQNNHAIVETVGLFIAKSWLGGTATRCRKLLERLVCRWIADDGSWTQYSPNYHRAVLDALSIAELWRSRSGLAAFSDTFYSRVALAIGWLAQLIDPDNGRAPNLGANDSTRLLSMDREDPRDFRGTLAMASAVFQVPIPELDDGAWCDRLQAFRLPAPGFSEQDLASATLPDSGLHILRAGSAKVFLKYPHNRFRPPQADALHCDVWLGGNNIAPDSGSYRYTSPEDENAYFSGTSAHNTIVFDGCDQMPRLGRFLFGDWLKADQVKPVEQDGSTVSAAAAYRNRRGHFHQRALRLTESALVCADRFSGYDASAFLYWHLSPAHWEVDVEGALGDGTVSLLVEGGGRTLKPQLGSHFVSTIYGQREPIIIARYDLTSLSDATTTITFT